VGVAGSDFDFHKFETEFRSMSVYGTGAGILFNDKGEILIHPDFDETTEISELEEGAYSWIADEIENSSQGLVEFTWTDDDKKIMSFSKLSNDWVCAIVASKKSIYENLINQLIQNSLLMGLGIVIASFIVYTLISKQTIQLEKVTQIISETGDGNYDVSIPQEYIKDKGEVGVLATAVEVMRQKQKDSFDEIQSYSEDLESLVEKRTNELEESNQELEISILNLKETQESLIESRKTEAISQFIIEIAHRMNTPLGNVSMTLSFMEDSLTDIYKNVNENIDSNTNNVRIKDLEDLKKSIQISVNETGKLNDIIAGLQLLKDDFSNELKDKVMISDLIKISYSECKNTLDVCESLVLSLEGCMTCELDSYPHLLVEVFRHLLNYSVKYSMNNVQNKMIKIELTEETDNLVIRFSDASVLTYTALKGKVFEPYSLSSFKTGAEGMEMLLVYHIIYFGLGGDIECVEGDTGKPQFIIRLPY